VWYKVCRVAKWGDTPAVFLADEGKPQEKPCFYKLPKYFTDRVYYVGDYIRLKQVGYSASRNLIAQSIEIRSAHPAKTTEPNVEEHATETKESSKVDNKAQNISCFPDLKTFSGINSCLSPPILSPTSIG